MIPIVGFEQRSLGVHDVHPDAVTSVEYAARAATWLGDALAHVEQLGALPANWDSYGSAPVAMSSIVQACRFVTELAHVPGVMRPAITATPDGEVGFCWDTGRWSLDAAVEPSGAIRYAFVASDPPQERESVTRDISDLIPLLTRS